MSASWTPANVGIVDLYYKKIDLGGSYPYDFKLKLTNNDSLYAPGQGFNWIIFGDMASGTSTLPDFSLSWHTFPNPGIIFTFSGGGITDRRFWM